MSHVIALQRHVPATPVRRRHVVAAIGMAAVLGVTPILAARPPPSQSVLAASSVTELRTGARNAHNTARLGHCGRLKASRKLTVAAQRHADDMARTRVFSHTSADGTAWTTRIRAAGWRQPGGENIAYGFVTAAGVVSAWMHSPDHRRNIMDCNFAYVGFGYNPVGDYWVADYGY